MSDTISQMKTSWNARAQKDAFFFIETKHWNNNVGDFFAYGEERAKVLIDPVLSEFGINGSGETAIDIGCGVGRFTQALGRRFGKVVGIDVSDDMIAQARVASPGCSNLAFIASDGVSLPQPSNTADFVWSYEVFQHMPSHEVIESNLREIQRVLRPAGYGLLHFKSVPDLPMPLWRVTRFVPTPLIRLVKLVLGKNPLTADLTWRGAKPLKKPEIRLMCRNTGLEIVQFRDDPTHKAGTCVLALVRREAH